MKLQFYKYRLPFATPLVTSKTTFSFREGYILKYTSEDGFLCYSEAAPLPGFSSENMENLQQQIISQKETINVILAGENPVKSLQQFYKKSAVPPSLQFGLDNIAYQVEAFRKSSSLQDFLFKDAPKRIPINALVSLQEKNYLKKVEEYVSTGFKTIKFKIGLNFNGELKKLEKIRSQFGELCIRLDANQAWEVDEAVSNLLKLHDLDIEYCEEPLKTKGFNKYRVLKQETDIPLALDESLYRQNWQSILPFVSVLILKPMVLGSFSKIFVTKRLADTHDNKVVITSSLESGVGRFLTAILASGLGTQNVAQGLNTSTFLAQDIFTDESYISNGIYDLSSYKKWINMKEEKLRDLNFY